jgi:hypothetical protein
MNKLIVLTVGIMLIGCHRGTHKQDAPDIRQTPPESKIEKAFISFRIGVPVWISESRCNELFDLFDRHKGVTDEITFFTSETHPPIPLEEFKRRAEILKGRMEEARKRGYRAGINILSSIGHHNENLDNSLKGNYVNMTNIEGAVCNGSFCPNDENMRGYIREIYQSASQANPDYIWIDDDIRFGHMPIGYGCFCDNCLAIFEKETGTKYTRETLKKALNEGPSESKLGIRKAWLQHNRNTIAHLFKMIEETVHAVNPAISLGFMTGDRFFEGYDFDNWAKILSGANRVPVMWRPGGGFYEDSNTRELVGKSHDVGRQISVLPAEVVDIQSEIENFPYQRLKKAANSVVLEACSHMAAGCTGAAFNVLSMYDEPLDEYEPLVSRLQESRPFFDLMAKSLGRSPIAGIQTFWNKDSYITGNLDNGNWTSAGNPLVSHEFYDIGLPICYSNGHAAVTLLGKDAVFALTKEEITRLLSGGVYLDVPALQQLNALGFSDLTGFEAVKSENRDRIEKFAAHPLNGNLAGRKRDNRQSFWNSPGYTLQPTGEKAETLSFLIDYTGQQVAPVTTGIFVNRLGGRVCVAGYYPWTFMGSLSKSSQVKAVFRWLSKDTLPGYIASFHRMNLWVRDAENGKISLAFTNSSFDAADKVVLMLKTGSRTIRVYDMSCRETVIQSTGGDGPYRKFVVPEVGPWQMRLAVCE